MVYSFNFTKNSLVNIEPASTRKRYRDSGGSSSVQGLGLEVTKSGTKTFNFIQKVNGKNLQITLGRFPEITVEQARKLAREAAHSKRKKVSNMFFLVLGVRQVILQIKAEWADFGIE